MNAVTPIPGEHKVSTGFEASNCCGANFLGETDVCSKCMEHAADVSEDWGILYTPSYVSGFTQSVRPASYVVLHKGYTALCCGSREEARAYIERFI